MPEIVDIDELVPEDIEFKYRGETYTIPGDLRTDQTLKLYALLVRLAKAEAKGNAAELGRTVGQAEAALLPIFQVYRPELKELPFGAAALAVVLRRVLTLIGLLEVAPAADPQEPAPKPAPRGRPSTRKTTPRSRRKR